MVQVTYDPEAEQQRRDQQTVGRLNNKNVTEELTTDRPMTVTEKAYRVVTTSMMNDPIRQTDPNVALNLLETSLTNRNVPFAKHYIQNMHRLINKENALRILLSIGRWLHSPAIDQPFNFEPSAPPLADNEEEMNDFWMREPLGRLREDVLKVIDTDGDYFLKHKSFYELHYHDVLDIVNSDNLFVSSELLVYSAVMKWGVEECERKEKIIEDDNMKAVLKDLLYAPRYGLLKKTEFKTLMLGGYGGPDSVGIQTDMNDAILHYIIEKRKKRPVKELPRKMSKPRRPRVDLVQTQPVKEKMILNCLTCFTAVFD
ncbi:uncharacterized protein LOC126739389 isoform X2 [Anthonomus grandis grandis]|nr:uncharacterized protein LOC126739389 isoform X2 [Anthonomus grandis grandis]XP_050301006.1 uncharacterized protein LOC126739389 isoform X2 [Anthonomus grandis grandis]XP_050301007.1 uncharacterized protein LOC126739389 isoform X2 [Anthonomus grandis grandis]XP_050301008.1 uncharacterized protein LOC126739389 isoform X2 [Anthonomus grandis grandis]